MAEPLTRLPDHHLAEAKKLVLKHRTRKSCNKCYDRGYTGITADNMLVSCVRCVDEKALMDDWKAYIKQHDELVELYGDSLEEPKEED